MMALPSVDNTIPDRPFLRTATERDPFVLPATANHDANDQQNPWPLPNEADTLLQLLDQWGRFAIVAIQIDRPAMDDRSEVFHHTVKAALGLRGTALNGRWFEWCKGRYGCALYDLDAATAMAIAGRLQAELAQQWIETISIGIAQFPFLNFDRPQSLVNAQKALDHAAFFGPGSRVVFDSISLNISADHFYQILHLEQAIEEYRLALQVDPRNLTARNSLGICLVEAGDLAAAQTEFETVRTMAPHDAMAVFNLGLLHLRHGETDQALDCFFNAHEAAPATFDIAFQIGKLLTEQAQWSKALLYLDIAQQLRTNWGPVYCLQGQCRMALDQGEAAIAAFKKAVKFNPNDANALSNLGTLYAKKGENLDICLAFCQQSILIDPDNGLFHLRLAKLLHQNHQWEKALAEYRLAATQGHADERAIEELHAQLAKMTSAADLEQTKASIPSRL